MVLLWPKAKPHLWSRRKLRFARQKHTAFPWLICLVLLAGLVFLCGRYSWQAWPPVSYRHISWHHDNTLGWVWVYLYAGCLFVHTCCGGVFVRLCAPPPGITMQAHLSTVSLLTYTITMSRLCCGSSLIPSWANATNCYAGPWSANEICKQS